MYAFLSMYMLGRDCMTTHTVLFVPVCTYWSVRLCEHIARCTLACTSQCVAIQPLCTLQSQTSHALYCTLITPIQYLEWDVPTVFYGWVGLRKLLAVWRVCLRNGFVICLFDCLSVIIACLGRLISVSLWVFNVCVKIFVFVN